MTGRRRIGVALGSGGARGWCHIGVLRGLEAMGISPDIVAGCSMGAVVGAAYAAGRLDALEEWGRSITPTRLLKLVDLRFKGGGMVEGRGLMAELAGLGLDCKIEEMEKTFAVVATNLDTGHEVWMRDGPLLPALRASLAIPGVFTPTFYDGHWLADGGITNPVPVSACRALGADIVIAVSPFARQNGTQRPPEAEGQSWTALEERLGLNLPDWLSRKSEQGSVRPSTYEVMNSSLNILNQYLRRTRLATDPPDLLIEVSQPDLMVLEFYRAAESIDAGRKEMDDHAAALIDLI